jgi:hypothetical protein
MKKLSIIILSITLLLSCSKEDNTTKTYTNTNQKNWFEYDGTRYYPQSMTIGQVNSSTTDIAIKASYVDSPNHIFAYAIITLHNTQKDSITGAYGAYNTSLLAIRNFYAVERSDGTTFVSSPNCAKTVTKTLDQYKSRITNVSGYYYMYEGRDSTKRHTINFNFSFD